MNQPEHKQHHSREIYFLLFCCIALALSVAGCQDKPVNALASQAPGTPTPTLTAAQVEQQPGWAQVLNAQASWEKGDAVTAVKQISSAQKSAKDDRAFFLHAGDVLAQAQSWPLAAVMYLNLKRIQGDNLPPDELNKIHEAAYRSGADAQAARVFTVFSDPWLDLGRTRFTLRNGEVDIAANDIQSVIADPSLLAQFPEALLVETEVYIAQKDWAKANADLDRLLTLANLPDWIKTEASRLRGLAQPN
jgi:hypothetical protein